MSLQRRIERMEEDLCTRTSIDEARRTFRCLLEIGAIDPVDDVEVLARQYAVEGRSMSVILDEIDGTSRGLPNPSELTDTEGIQQ